MLLALINFYFHIYESKIVSTHVNNFYKNKKDKIMYA